MTIKNRVLKLYPSAYRSINNTTAFVGNFANNPDGPVYAIRNISKTGLDTQLGYWADSEEEAWEAALEGIMWGYLNNDPR